MRHAAIWLSVLTVPVLLSLSGCAAPPPAGEGVSRINVEQRESDSRRRFRREQALARSQK